MSGWICVFGNTSSFDQRLNNFKSKFTIEGIPELRITVDAHFANFRVISWAWTKSEIPDLYVCTHLADSVVLCGVITELANVCSTTNSQHQIVEKLLGLWLKEGDKTVSGLNGSFSCLFYTHKQRQVTIFSDRFASRSAWFGNDHDTWILGNYPSAVVSLMSRNPQIDAAGIWSLFHAGRQVGNHSLYSNVGALMAGQKMVLKLNSEPRISHWWTRKYNPEKNFSPQELGYQIAQAIKKSASQYKKISKNPYLFLSGGLDSRIVAAAFKNPLRTLTICTKPNMESRIATCISKIERLEHRVIFRSPYWYLDNAYVAALISSGIYLNQHAHFITPVTIVLSEEREAEFFLGDLLENFNKHYFSLPANYSLNFAPERISENLYSAVPYTIKNYNKKRGSLFNKEIKYALERSYLEVLIEYARSTMEVSKSHEDRFDSFLRWSNVGITPTYNMITCIRPFARERNIYFDNHLDDLALKIPPQIRGKGVLHKWIIYYLNRVLLVVPDSNTFLPPIIPRKLAYVIKNVRPFLGSMRRSRIKNGQGTPSLKTSGSWLLLHELYRKDRLYREHIESIIFDEKVFFSDLFNLDEIKKTWEEYLAGNVNLHFEIEALISFGSLQKAFPCSGIDF